LLGASNQLLAAVKGTPKARASMRAFLPSKVSEGVGGTINRDAVNGEGPGVWSGEEVPVPRAFTKREHVACWLNLQKKCYDIQPDKDEVVLPFAFKNEVFEAYRKESTAGPDFFNEWLPCTQAYFNRVWKADVPDLKCQKYHRFQMCDICISFNEKLRMRNLEPAARKLFVAAKADHLRVVREDRYNYECRIYQCKQYPKEVMDLAIDGSDNGQYGFPYFAEKTKETDKGWKLKTKLYAALVHGWGACCYVFNAHLPGETNVTVNVLHETLQQYQYHGNALPPVLSLQLDNTVKDNKSKYLFAYLQGLVDCGVFKEINVFFFQVGHTHCDIDQLFSRIANFLKGKHCFSFDQLCEMIKLALGGLGNFVKYAGKLNGFVNWRDAIKPLMVPSNQTAGITAFHVFRIRRTANGGHEFMCRRSLSDPAPWSNFKMQPNQHQVLLKDDLVLTPEFFVGQAEWPPFVVPPLADPDGKETEFRMYKKSIEACSDRMIRLTEDRGLALSFVAELNDELNLMKDGATMLLVWDTSLYSNPKLVPPEEIGVGIVSQQEFSDYQRIVKDTVQNRNYKMAHGLPLELSEVLQSNIVVVDNGRGKNCYFNYPFWLGRVLKIYPNPDPSQTNSFSLKIARLVPVIRSNKDRGNMEPLKYLNSSWAQDMKEIPNKNLRSSKRDAVPFTSKIHSSNILLCFEKLHRKEKIPPRCQQELIESNYFKGIFREDVSSDSEDYNNELSSSEDEC
jgi:hypothetical protein